jgi:hypothetical protein
MPPLEALPPEIAALATRQALPLSDADWGQHVEDLLTQLKSRMSESHRVAVARRDEPRGDTSPWGAKTRSVACLHAGGRDR